MRNSKIKTQTAFCLLLSVFSLLLFPFSLFAQQPIIDIDENTQNRIMATPVQNCDLNAHINVNQITIIENNNRIPAYGLYQNEWDTLYIRSKKLEIPFFDNQLKIMLIQEGNTPFAFPISGVISTGFVKNRNRQHTGVDFSVQKNEPVVAAFDGVVRIVKKFEEYGNTVVIRHYNGLETLYALLDNVNVITGQKVNAGDLIGYVGNKRKVLHFETRFLNEFFNPEKVINFSERKLQNNMLTLTPSDFISVPLVNVTPVVKQEEREKGEKEKGERKGEEVGKTLPESSKTTPVYHTVQKGETIYRITVKYGITEQQLRSLNKIKGDKIEIGQKLRIR
ncbi:MAG: peptidoglycan DD-metalloendopeptidase family protein [Bacteroidetes bacterium]|nr:peptidoglycan DD-metalloendopeptidase family protein [Bacteroidota bacterium]MCL2302476.1 peptidoglycan DD-metalloendopeptidase family protein [Lentimicrobiaceae bacterium]